MKSTDNYSVVDEALLRAHPPCELMKIEESRMLKRVHIYTSDYGFIMCTPGSAYLEYAVMQIRLE